MFSKVEREDLKSIEVII